MSLPVLHQGSIQKTALSIESAMPLTMNRLPQPANVGKKVGRFTLGILDEEDRKLWGAGMKTESAFRHPFITEQAETVGAAEAEASQPEVIYADLVMKRPGQVTNMPEVSAASSGIIDAHSVEVTLGNNTSTGDAGPAVLPSAPSIAIGPGPGTGSSSGAGPAAGGAPGA